MSKIETGYRAWLTTQGGELSRGKVTSGAATNVTRLHNLQQPLALAVPRRSHKTQPPPQIATSVHSSARAGWHGAQRSRLALDLDLGVEFSEN